MADIPVELLRRAWPEGYLAKRGVATVRGAVCIDPAVSGDALWTFPTRNEEHYVPVTSDRSPLRFTRDGSVSRNATATRWVAGDFLPNVDPADTATWACLLADLAEAGERRTGQSFPVDLGLIFNADPIHTMQWVLLGWATRITWAVPPTRDPALALVWCRIYEREREPGSKESS